MEQRYKLEKSKDEEGWWVLTDLKHLIVIKFREHEFNETQRVTAIDEQLLFREAEAQNIAPQDFVARVMQEMGKFVYDCHYSIALPTPIHEIRHAEDYSYTMIIRHKYPRFAITVDDNCTIRELCTALKKTLSWLSHLEKHE